MKFMGREGKYRSIFSPSTSNERNDNFEKYWEYTLRHDGEILEDQKNLTIKRDILARFQNEKVRSRKPLPNPALFYRNYVKMQDDPRSIDRKTLLLTCIYKFARHEWAGISGAWESIPSMAEAKSTTDKISRYHLCEEFCHVRLFHEMFRTFQLEDVEWVPMGKGTQLLYKVFPHFPEALMSTPAFLSELMGITFYQHLDRLFDSVLADEPEARDRLRALLNEIMVDELAHIGQRRNYIGPLGIRLARWMFRPMLRIFYHDIPEAKYLFDIDQMIRDGLAFDYNQVSSHLLERSWVPSYCQV
jgi:hypothetical protein